jgi:hypothetical protein
MLPMASHHGCRNLGAILGIEIVSLDNSEFFRKKTRICGSVLSMYQIYELVARSCRLPLVYSNLTETKGFIVILGKEPPVD